MVLPEHWIQTVLCARFEILIAAISYICTHFWLSRTLVTARGTLEHTEFQMVSYRRLENSHLDRAFTLGAQSSTGHLYHHYGRSKQAQARTLQASTGSQCSLLGMLSFARFVFMQVQVRVR